jgi:hypothetical protein
MAQFLAPWLPANRCGHALILLFAPLLFHTLVETMASSAAEGARCEAIVLRNDRRTALLLLLLFDAPL